MSPFVVLALALAVVSLAAAAVAAVQLVRVVRGLRSVAQQTTQRLTPLVDELTAEAAVSSTEVEALQQRLDTFAQQRREASRGVRRASTSSSPVPPTITYTGR